MDPSRSNNVHHIRQLVKYGPDYLPATVIGLISAGRAEMLERFIKPTLASGVHVISHRWLADSMAYQDYDLAREVHKVMCDDFRPDLQIILDAPAKKCIERIKRRTEKGAGDDPDKYDNDSEEVMEGRRSLFMRQVFVEGVAIVDADREIKNVVDDVNHHIFQLLGLE